MTRWGVVLLVFGILYVAKPNIFQRWFWKRTEHFPADYSVQRSILYL